MSVRKFINDRPKTAAAIIGVFFVGCAGYAFTSMQTAAASGDGQRQIYFSTDDGMTYFADAWDKPSGFMKDGKPAYEACVYAKAGGEPKVGFLRRIGQLSGPPAAPAPTPVAVPKKAGVPAPPPPPPPPPKPTAGASGPQTLVKRPGEKDWHAVNDADGQKLLAEFGPTAQQNGQVEAVLP